jgi:hypothetical protein
MICPHCDIVQRAFVNIELHPDPPKPGNLNVCSECTGVSIFYLNKDKKLALRVIYNHEILMMKMEGEWEGVERIQKIIRDHK